VLDVCDIGRSWKNFVIPIFYKMRGLVLLVLAFTVIAAPKPISFFSTYTATVTETHYKDPSKETIVRKIYSDQQKQRIRIELNQKYESTLYTTILIQDFLSKIEYRLDARNDSKLQCITEATDPQNNVYAIDPFSNATYKVLTTSQ
jgi:hypothetical protein